jgi:hypothetical protein
MVVSLLTGADVVVVVVVDCCCVGADVVVVVVVDCCPVVDCVVGFCGCDAESSGS